MFKTTPEVPFLSGVTETRQREVESLRPERMQEPSYGLRTPNWHNGNTLGRKITTAALGERLQRALVADAFDEHDRARVNDRGRRDVCQVKSPFLVHSPYLH